MLDSWPRTVKASVCLHCRSDCVTMVAGIAAKVARSIVQQFALQAFAEY